MSPILTIGVDARELLGEATGVGRYLGELMRRWTMREDRAQRRFLLYTPAPLPCRFEGGAAEVCVGGRGNGTWWEQTALARRVRTDRPDVFFAPAYSAPLAPGVPVAVTIHDISFVAHPEWFRPRERWRRRIVTSRTAAAAGVVLTDSQFSREEIASRLGVPSARIRVIPPGVSAMAAGAEAAPGRVREPIALYVGSLFNRRRLPDLIAAFAQAVRRGPAAGDAGGADAPDAGAASLVIVGADRTWPRQDLAAVAARHGVAGRVDIRHYVAEAELRDLYRRAAVFAFLSEYEGFGLTPLEALAAGVPIVVLDTPVAREVYGEAADYVQAGDIAGTAAALARRLERPGADPGPLARAGAVLGRYSWDRAADDTLAAIESVVPASRRPPASASAAGTARDLAARTGLQSPDATGRDSGEGTGR